MKLPTAILLLCSCAAFADRYAIFDSIAGPAQYSGIIGNGRLTAAFDAQGRLNELHWPAPSAPGQLGIDTGIIDGAPAAFGLRAAQATEWLAFTPRGAEPGVFHATRDGVDQIMWIQPDRDIAVVQLRFAQAPSDREVVWCADFSPCTKAVAGIPSAEIAFPGRSDMFAFAEKGTVYHLRLSDANSMAWDALERWAHDSSKPVLTKKDSGVWIAYSTGDGLKNVICTSPLAARKTAEDGQWNADEKCIGDGASAALIPVAEDNTATLYIAFGERRSDVDDALQLARQKGAGALLEETRAWWRDRLAACTQPQIQDETLKAAYQTSLTTLSQCAEPETGAVVRAPFSMPPFATDFPRLGAWTTLALDLANQRAQAAKHIEFYAKSLRVGDRPGAPEGSIPAALYGTGVEAAPQNILDVEGASWLLWSFWQHDAFEPDADRADYRASMWPAIERAGNFISSWSRAIHQTPGFSFDPARMSDSSKLETIACVYAGLRSATDFAQAFGHEKPDWKLRLTELEEYLRFRALDADGQFKIADPLALWSADLVGPGDPRWLPIVQRAIDEIPQCAPADALKTLTNLAMLLRDQKDMLARIAPLLPPTVSRALAEYPGDAYYAALTVTATLTVYSHGSF